MSLIPEISLIHVDSLTYTMFPLEYEDLGRRGYPQFEKIVVEKIKFSMRFSYIIQDKIPSVSQIFHILMSFGPNAQRFAAGFLNFLYIY